MRSLRVVDPQGKQAALFPGKDYLTHVAEHVEPWSYVKYSYLKNIGWKHGQWLTAVYLQLPLGDGAQTPPDG